MRPARISRPLGVIALILGAGVSHSADHPVGYLDPQEFDVTRIIPPAPEPGDPRYAADRRIFRATRALAGSPRYELATHDVRDDPASMLRNFSCSVGVALTPDNAPRLTILARRAASDTTAQSRKAKDVYKRKRPFLLDRGRICQPHATLLDARSGQTSYDYPSGHTTLGWTWGLVLANLAPDRASQILDRARAFGDSRFICGAHNFSAVQAAKISASATLAVVQSKPEFQTDRDAARIELAALRAKGPRPADCDAEARLIQPLNLSGKHR